MGKHAYLIICHNNFRILKKLISLLDDPRNDIYIHVDRKVKHFDQWKQGIAVERATITFVKRINVNWGGFSQVKAELVLLEEAVKKEHTYYHLISGVDMPLKSQDEIHNFFNRNFGKEFIGIDEQSEGGKAFTARVGHYRIFQDIIGRNTGLHIALIEKFENLLIMIQTKAKINRLAGYDGVMRKGSQWFSITHRMAEYVLENRKRIYKLFQFGLCVDELFLQTIAMESLYAENIVNDTLRYIDWNRGSPYVFTSEDYELLLQSGKLFARKFDEKKDFVIVEKIYRYINN